MEVIIDSKKNNPLLNRTEVHFTIKHEGESTPSRDIIRNELADKLNSKKENIIVNNISSSFGSNETVGYAKIYTSIKQSKDLERKHLLTRDKIISEEKKEKKEGKPAEPASPTGGETEQPSEPPKDEVKPEEPADTTGEKQEEPVAPAEDKPVEPPTEEKPAEPSEPPTEEEKTQDESKPEETEKKEDDEKKE